MIEFNENGRSEIHIEDGLRVWVEKRGAGEPLVYFARKYDEKAQSIELGTLETLIYAIEYLKGDN